jgi:hypothetical protein
VLPEDGQEMKPKHIGVIINNNIVRDVLNIKFAIKLKKNVGY